MSNTLRDYWAVEDISEKRFRGKVQIYNGNIMIRTNASLSNSQIVEVIYTVNPTENYSGRLVDISFEHEGKKYIGRINITDHSHDSFVI
tara:strand:- start:634 stop:900 length:267 start_codon:yes stop_codon:yes gene_type:complete